MPTWAEDTSGRFRLALEALAEAVPLIVIELRCWQGAPFEASVGRAVPLRYELVGRCVG